ncbi:acyltransferase family protein [Allomuricauda sp. d1]|uniref:acyltransferase family protein n=1 Tax=Allomuricauda sp. d1 TaxID=3136725 RepID=UPI0031CF07F6
MKPKSTRLFFIDAMRAWAILMMLQGHFIDGLLDTIFRNPENPIYTIWLYFRGITAPVFFTVSGFIFTYLLVRVPQTGWNNPRVKKGIRRGLQLLIIGYLLRLNIFGLFEGKIYEGFYLVDVLHCIGLSILAIIGVYVLTEKWKKFAFPLVLIAITLVLFLFEPLYKQWSFAFLPSGLANYFTKVNGSVFTIIPWLGYTAFGGFLSLLFTRFKDSKHLYPAAIVLSVISGIELIFFSSDGFIKLYELTGIDLFYIIQLNNYLFIRLGDVFLVFAVFMLLRSLLTNTTILKIGQNTLSIYVIHFVILYGSFTGLGLYRFFYHELNPAVAISGAVAFMVACTALALWYDKNESGVKSRITFAINSIGVQVVIVSRMASLLIRELLVRIKMVLYRLFGFVQN